MKLVNSIGEKVHELLPIKKKESAADAFTVLIIEEDYVNFLFLNEVLASYNLNVLRAVTLEQAGIISTEQNSIDLLIVNISLTCGAQNSVIEYLREVYSVPVVVVDSGDKNNVRFQEVVDWADGIVSLNTDTEHILETISDMLGKSLSMPVNF